MVVYFNSICTQDSFEICAEVYHECAKLYIVCQQV